MIHSELDLLVENHLNLQVKISYSEHYNFLIRHGLGQCSQILDVGTGNGAFVARLAVDHPEKSFVGIDKRQACINSCRQWNLQNLSCERVDLFARESLFDFSRFDGFLMRYFLLHVDHAHKILELFKTKVNRPARFWVIDLDWSQMSCEPMHESFRKLQLLLQDFCSKVSVETMGGQKVQPLLEQLGYQNIQVEHLPFTSRNVPIEDLGLCLRQEIFCYSRMSGRSADDPETLEIMRFIDQDVASGNVQVSYGMILVSAQLSS